MKKNLHPTMIAIAILSITFGACKEKEKTIHVENVTLNKTNALLYIGDTLTLSASISPYNATNKIINWSSSDITIVTMDSNIVTAKKIGETTITVTTQDGSKTANCIVSVTMPAVGSRCNGNLPGWGASLGIVGFASNNTWTVGNQIWSDAVIATVCNKTDYAGGSEDNFNADCRSNPDYPGDLFSWCAVMRFATLLCPSPWRVPTQQDIRNLDITLGGNGEANLNLTLLAKYVGNDWGSAYSGACDVSGQLVGQGSSAYYWASEYNTDRHVQSLYLGSDGRVLPRMFATKDYGFSLRCVRDNN